MYVRVRQKKGVALFTQVCLIIGIVIFAFSLSSDPSEAGGNALYPIVVGTARDRGPLDGIFDELISDSNSGMLVNNGYTEARGAFEFELSSIPSGSAINSAILSVSIVNYEGSRSIQIHGYSGDGLINLPDFEINGYLGAESITPDGITILEFDVTSFIVSLMNDNQTYAGFNIRESPANSQNYLIMRVQGLSNPPPSSSILQLSIELPSPCPESEVTVNAGETFEVPNGCNVELLYNQGGIVTNYGSINLAINTNTGVSSTFYNHGSVYTLYNGHIEGSGSNEVINHGSIHWLYNGYHSDNNTATNYGSIYRVYSGFSSNSNTTTNFGSITWALDNGRSDGDNNTAINNGYVYRFFNGMGPLSSGNIAINYGSVNSFHNGWVSSNNTASNYGSVEWLSQNGYNSTTYTAKNNIYDNYGTVSRFENRSFNTLNRHCFSTVVVYVNYGGTYNDLCPPPSANDDSYNLMEGMTFSLESPGILSNDLDVFGDGLTVDSYDGTSLFNGWVTMNPDGSFTYTPASGFAGIDSFSYTVTEGYGEFDTATVEMTVNVENQRSIEIESVDGQVVGNNLVGTIIISDQSEDGNRDDLLVQITDFKTFVWWKKDNDWFRTSTMCADPPAVFSDMLEVHFNCKLSQDAQEAERYGLDVMISIFGRDKVFYVTQFLDENDGRK